MANAVQKAILTAKISGVLKDLMIKTNVDQVYIDDDTTLAKKLSELITALNGKAASSHTHAQSDITGLSTALSSRPTTDAMNKAISTAISNLIGGAPETYDTLKEIADYIEAHKDVTDALTAAIGNKADKTAVDTLSSTVTAIKKVTDGLGSLATKSKVSESDLDTALAKKVTDATAAMHSHSNKSVLDGITANLVATWSGKSKIYYSATEPTNLADGDMWVQLIE